MAMLETAATRALKRGRNGTLSFYHNNKQYIHALWVIAISQPHQINGSRHQSMHQAHWYPRSYAPGDITVETRCRTQRDYQRLSNLVRLHHRVMLETPGLRFSNRVNTTGRRHLMLLHIPSENITVRGWIPSFTITKRGVHDVAPECNFTFFTALDPYSSDPIISHKIREWWNPKKMLPVKDPFAIDPGQGKPNRDDPIGGGGQAVGDFGGRGGQ